MKSRYIFYTLVIMVIISCSSKKEQGKPVIPRADADNGGIELPEGFGATMVADFIGRGRHIVVRENGDIYLALLRSESGKGIAALRDTSGDGKADIINYFGDYYGTGIDIYNGYLYFAADTIILKYKFYERDLIPDTMPDIVVKDFMNQDQHTAKSITINEDGGLYVNVGAPSNACMEQTRTYGSPGMDPCPQLEKHGGIWLYDANKTNQKATAGKRYATGIRNAVALKWNPEVNKLYAVQHGRDQLAQLYPGLYDENAGVNLPAEEFFMIEEGDDFGWPYCYYDPFKVKKVLAPEYGGNGEITGRCESKKDPIMAFPAHLAPNSLLFYNANMFPVKYQHGSFIAFHGSWNRAPQVQKGYFVVFVPFKDGVPEGQWEIFADGFSGNKELYSPGDALHRPTGLALGPDGSLYISDSVRGTVWRVFYNSTK